MKSMKRIKNSLNNSKKGGGNMKRNIMSLAIAFVMVVGVASFASAGVIKGSAHDFTTQAWTNEICQPCHTPHNAGVAELLWNHEASAATYKAYSSYALTTGLITGIDATSKKCLACHDGTVNVDAFGGAAGAATITAYANFGSNLSNDHPIGFLYATAAAADGEIYNTAKAEMGTAITANGTMGCYTCHDVHNTSTPTGVPSLLRMTNASSALCLACHNK